MDRDAALKLLKGGREGVQGWNVRRSGWQEEEEEEVPVDPRSTSDPNFLVGLGSLSPYYHSPEDISDLDLSGGDLRGADLRDANLRVPNSSVPSSAGPT